MNAYMRRLVNYGEQQRFTILEVSADRHELRLIPSEFRNTSYPQKTRMLMLSDGERISTIN